ncbi:hypothetical protein ACOKS4_10695 [Janibacter sp. G349]|uniref:hypothetical protein n=1 Tax=Janibacter sp. G349 TaxID=3405424 RepID=UPI003B7D9D5B
MLLSEREVPERDVRRPVKDPERPVLETQAVVASVLRIGVVATSVQAAGTGPAGGTTAPPVQEKDSTLTKFCWFLPKVLVLPRFISTETRWVSPGKPAKVVS